MKCSCGGAALQIQGSSCRASKFCSNGLLLGHTTSSGWGAVEEEDAGMRLGQLIAEAECCHDQTLHLQARKAMEHLN